MTPSTTPLQPQHFTPLDEHAQERFARSLVAHLNQSQEELPYVVTERLRAAREQAVAQRKRGAAPLRQYASAPQLQTAGVGGHLPDNTASWIRKALTFLPLLILAIGVITIGIQEDSRATVGLANVDAELLTSALPPDAYTDPGFLHFLETSQKTTP
ncbi:MAG: DUF3619 family protein [Comamonas sp.]|jgi:hypothetical protein|uniref:DUF3619 family protein n=1 Tax=Comamonas denitrificans TaxID=117506 RepID=A0A939H1B1_9BURK|nr:DUF3619 family protein [Comamonas denitrificans]MBP6042545.1 DUF3619 family protein [Comamonas sp.]MCZ2106122.1 DUF3619 family protein [Burkholderiales bacterium]MBO1249761.1 DUF3619 family protein [Comamonas denitrificans]MBP7840465.1 DUF3619 family protein [Comamonas sp.]MBP7855079.1 DUF3619 family protein [Comamonas sp.]